VTNLRRTLTATAPIAVWAAAACLLPAAATASTNSFDGPIARAASHARGTHGKQPACKSHSSAHDSRAPRKPNCRATKRPQPKRTPRRSTTGSGGGSSTSPSQNAAAQAATIAQVLATPCPNTSLTPEPANLPLIRASVLCLINTERAQHGESPLSTSRRLEAAAESHGKEMLAQNYFDHVSPSGVTPVDRVREAGYIPNSEVGYVIGENLAWGTLTLSTPEAIVAAWIASPEHLANILEAKYRETGIDVEPEVPAELSEGVEGALYTQEFGVIER
jgi:uncharacterized protein YkwD